jgi:FKBP-type peptidyl-prolyl cis-trans isomerase
MRRVIRLVLLVSLASLAACTNDNGDSNNPAGPSGAAVQFSTTDLRVGTGTEAVNGQRLTVHYTGWLYDAAAADNKGRQFQTTVGTTPYIFMLGAGQVIRGWDQGIVGMRVGGLRRLVIPPNLGYGSQGAGTTVPPNATLIFEVELVSIG